MDDWPYPEIEKRYANQDTRWFETSEDVWWDQLECVPPAAMKLNAFAVGEPYTYKYVDGVNCAVHAVFVALKDRFFCRLSMLRDFKVDQYNAEIKEQFEIN